MTKLDSVYNLLNQQLAQELREAKKIIEEIKGLPTRRSSTF